MDEFIPSEFYLGQNYPNPFKEKTIIKYCVAYKTRVKLAVYNSEGEVIKKIMDEEKDPGTYEVGIFLRHLYESRDKEETRYIYRLEAGDYKNEKIMEIIK